VTRNAKEDCHGFRTALLALLSFFYDLPYMHAVLWITPDILILFFALALLPATLVLLVLASLLIANQG
jgi:hypothetical protein